MKKLPLSMVLKLELERLTEERCRLGQVVNIDNVTREMFEAYKVGFKQGLEELVYGGEFDYILKNSQYKNDLGKNYSRFILDIVDDKLEDLYRRRLKYIH